MNKQQYQQLLKQEGIPAPPLPPDDVLPQDADIEEYLAQVYLHCTRVEQKLIPWRPDRRVFEVEVRKDGKFRGILKLEVEPTIQAIEVEDEAE